MRRHRFIAILALSPALLFAGGCGREGEETPEPRAARPVSGDTTGATVPTRYLSAFAFSGTVTGSSQLYLELLNETSASDLRRDYRGWIAPAGVAWTELLAFSDTLPVPRAAWRVLPGGGLRVLVGDGSEVVGLAYADSLRRIRLQPGSGIAEWTGPTGQRELLALATLGRDSVTEPGLLYFRRAARTAGAPEDRVADLLLLLSDTRGNGLLVARTETDTAAAAFAWGWLERTRSRWTDVLLRPSPGRAGGAGAAPDDGAGTGPRAATWRLEVPSAGLAADLRVAGSIDPAEPSPKAGPDGAEDRGAAGAGGPSAGEPRIVLLDGSLRTPEGTRSVRGLLLRIRLP